MFLMMESVRPLMTSSHLRALSALKSNRCTAGKAKSGLTAQQDGWGKGEHVFSDIKSDIPPFIVQECPNEGSVHIEIRDEKGYQVILSILLQ